MLKFIITAIYAFIILTTTAYAGRTQYIDLKQFINSKADSFNDIGYLHIVPKFEENMDPKRAITMELYFGEFDGSDESIKRLEYIKTILADEQKLNPNFDPEIIGIGHDTGQLKHSKDLQTFLEAINYPEHKVHFDEIPKFLNHHSSIQVKKNPLRLPASTDHTSKLLNGRKIWTLVRFSSIMAGSTAALYFMEGTSAQLAASIAFWPGLVSGAMTYYSNAYGAFMTSGRWATWLIESNNIFARTLRVSLGINKISLDKALKRNKDHFRSKYPRLYNQNSSLFKRDIESKSKQDVIKSKIKVSNILEKLRKAEEYFKWWVTEIAFTGTMVKLPQAIAGVSEFGGILAFTSDVLVGSTMGMLAQGPGDIAIQVRKYQMVEELKKNILSGNGAYQNRKQLLLEIDKVLSKTGEHQAYLIHDGSHKQLVKIENWSRSRATILSIFAVSGVGMEIAGIPLARPMLLGIGLWGATYYSVVEGWINPEKLTAPLKRYIQKFKENKIPFSLQAIKTRMCSTPYMLK